MSVERLFATFGVAYRVIDDDMGSLDLLAGARYFNLDVDFDAVVGASKFKYSDSGDALDGIIGGQALIALDDRWYVSFYGDTFDDLSFSGPVVGVKFRFQKAEFPIKGTNGRPLPSAAKIEETHSLLPRKPNPLICMALWFCPKLNAFISLTFGRLTP